MNPENTAEAQLPEPSPLRSTGPAVALALCLIAIAVASIFGTSNRTTDIDALKTKVQLQPPDWSPTTAEVERLGVLAQTRRAVQLDPNDLLSKRLLHRMEEFHRIEALPGANARSAAYQDAHAQYKQRALDYLKVRGQGGYLALGQKVVDEYVAALRDNNKVTIERLGGRFYRRAKSSRLINDKGIAGTAEEQVVRLALMEGWLSPLRSTQVVESWTHPLERIVLRRWKLVAQNLSPKRRTQLAKELIRLQSGYPVWWAMGGHAADARDWISAALYYEKALSIDSDNQTLQLNLEYAQERARRNQ